MKTIRPDDFDEPYLVLARALIFEKIQDPDALFFTTNMARVWGPGRFPKKIRSFIKKGISFSGIDGPDLSGDCRFPEGLFLLPQTY